MFMRLSALARGLYFLLRRAVPYIQAAVRSHVSNSSKYVYIEEMTSFLKGDGAFNLGNLRNLSGRLVTLDFPY